MQDNIYSYNSVAQASPETRVAFIRKTYLHLVLAIVAFVIGEYFAFQSGMAMKFLEFLSSMGRSSWLLVIGLVWVGNMISNSMMVPGKSKALQYAGLGVEVLLEVVIFIPILAMAALKSDASIITQAAIMTGFMTVGLTVVAFTSKKDFSWLGGIISMGLMVAMGLIVCSIIFGFSLGSVFSAVMVVLAAGSILYTTSNIQHHYPKDAYVAASAQLFSSVMMLFFFLLRLIMDRD